MSRCMKKYEAVRGELDTGDIVLFSGTGFVSRMIQMFSGSEFSHVGMVVNIKEYDMLLLFESTTLSKVKHIDTHQSTQGVQLVPLSERVKCYGRDKVVFRKLEGVTRSPDMVQDFKIFRKEVKGRPYEQSKIELAKSAFDLFPDQDEDLSSLFCSELIAEMYQRWGLFIGAKEHPNFIPSNEYTPADFQKDMSMKGGKLSQCIRV
jgi:hypothetical protein